ncbi:uncharacterized protein CDAR_381701 [Caerostris darwini]|uniref:Tc1-like transposase DDE domain-containing protein n=1 Tax=Caerostris darwini TaxID=1538125 RepID=A0AAV4V6F4_9ARAC|nr:uncharacterized protein CDAR_381701 [Caerostris darwini]
MDISPRKRTRISNLSQHTTMTRSAIGVYQQNLASKLTTKFLQEIQKLTVLDWPGYSPDVNLIKNLWNIVKRHVSKMDCSTKSKMIENVKFVCNVSNVC